MKLTPEQARVVGALIEKERTTPDHYPLTTNALVSACNQRNNRDPIVAFDDRQVDSVMLELREAGICRTVRGSGHRTHKHRHVLDEALGLDDRELALAAVLLLRGPQTPGELRTRTERYVAFPGPDDVVQSLEGMAARAEPLVANLGRQPGQSQDRWMHLLGDGEMPEPAAPRSEATGAGSRSALEARVATLEAQVARLLDELGLEVEAVPPPAPQPPAEPPGDSFDGPTPQADPRADPTTAASPALDVPPRPLLDTRDHRGT